jgi:hypothetical protein
MDINSFSRLFEKYFTYLGGKIDNIGSIGGGDGNTLDDIHTDLTSATEGYIREDLADLYRAVDQLHTDLGTLQSSASLAGITLPGSYFSPADFTASFNNATSIICTNTNGFTIDDSQCFVLSVMVKSATGTWKKYINGANGVSLTASAGTITIAGHTDTAFANTDLAYRVAINYQAKAFDPGTNSNNVTVLNNNNYTDAEQPVDEGTLAIGTYYLDIDMSGYRYAAIQINATPAATSGTVTITAWATLDPAASTSADTGWIDISTTILGAASLIATQGGSPSSIAGIYFIDTPIMPSQLRIKYVVATAVCAIDIFVKKY